MKRLWSGIKRCRSPGCMQRKTDMGHLRRFRQSKSLAEVAASIRGLAKRSKRLVKALRMELAVTDARWMMSEMARTHGADSGNFPLCRPEMMRCEGALKPSDSLAMPRRSTSPNRGGREVRL